MTIPHRAVPDPIVLGEQLLHLLEVVQHLCSTSSVQWDVLCIAEGGLHNQPAFQPVIDLFRLLIWTLLSAEFEIFGVRIERNYGIVLSHVSEKVLRNCVPIGVTELSDVVGGR